MLLASLRRVAGRLQKAPDVFEVALEIAKPCSRAAIEKAERELGVALPADLARLYTEDCASVSFAWSVRREQGYRIRARGEAYPTAQLDLRAPRELVRWHDTDLAVVFGDGTGDGIALDLAAGTFVTFDHDTGKGGAPRFTNIAAVVRALAADAFASEVDAELITPTLRRFLAGKATLAPARAPTVPSPPRAPRGSTRALPAVLPLAPHKSMVSALCMLDARRVVTAAYHEKPLVIRDVEQRAPLGKLRGAGKAIVLLADTRGRLISTGRGALERFELATGKAQVLSRLDPYTVQAELEGDDSLFAMSTAFLQRTRLVADAPTDHLLEVTGSRYWRRDRTSVVIAGSTSKHKLTLSVAALGRRRVGPVTEWNLALGMTPAGTWIAGELVLALDDGTLVGVDPDTLQPTRRPTAKRVAGPDVVLPDGRTWVVARATPQAVFDVYDLATREKRRTLDVPGATGQVTALGATPDGRRIVVGDHLGWLGSLDADLLR